MAMEQHVARQPRWTRTRPHPELVAPAAQRGGVAPLGAWVIAGLALLAGVAAHLSIVFDVWPLHGTSPGAADLIDIELAVLALWLGALLVLGRSRYRGDWLLVMLPVALVIVTRSSLFHAFSDPAYLPVGAGRADAARAKGARAQLAAATRTYTPERRSLVFGGPPRAGEATVRSEAYASEGVDAASVHWQRNTASLIAPVVMLAVFHLARRRRLMDLILRRARPATFALVFAGLLAVRLLASRSGRIGGFTLWELTLPPLVLLWASALAAEASNLARLQAMLFAPRVLRLVTYGVLPVIPFLFTGPRLEPDFGAVAMVCVVFAAMLLVATRQMWWALLIPVWFAVCALAYVAHPRVRERVETWRNPYPTATAVAATGQVESFQRGLFDLGLIRGGWLGEGSGRGHGEIAPNAADDGFVTLFGTQFGFLGCLTLALLYTLFLLRSLRIAGLERGVFERTLIVGFCALLGVPFWIAFLGGIGAVPLTGLAAGFVAHGGTKLVASAAVVGVLAALSERAEDHSSAPARPLRTRSALR